MYRMICSRHRDFSPSKASAASSCVRFSSHSPLLHLCECVPSTSLLSGSAHGLHGGARAGVGGREARKCSCFHWPRAAPARADQRRLRQMQRLNRANHFRCGNKFIPTEELWERVILFGFAKSTHRYPLKLSQKARQ